MTVHEKTAVSFIKWHFGSNLYIFSEDIYETFNRLVSEGKNIAAAEEYHKLNGGSIEQAHFAVTYAQSLAK